MSHWNVRERRTDDPNAFRLVMDGGHEGKDWPLTFETRQEAHDHAEKLNRARKSFSIYYQPVEAAPDAES